MRTIRPFASPLRITLPSEQDPSAIADEYVGDALRNLQAPTVGVDAPSVEPMAPPPAPQSLVTAPPPNPFAEEPLARETPNPSPLPQPMSAPSQPQAMPQPRAMRQPMPMPSPAPAPMPRNASPQAAMAPAEPSGTPSEGSVMAQQVADRFGNALRAFGAGVAGRGGSYQRTNRGDQMAAQRAQMLQQAQAHEEALSQRNQSRADALEQRDYERGRQNQSDELARSRLGLQEAQFRQQSERQGRQDALAERRAEQEERLRAAQEQLASARTAQEQIAARRAIESATVESESSNRARSRYVLEALSRERAMPAAQQRSREEIEREVQGMSAMDIEALERRLPGLTMGMRTSGAGGSGGGVRTGPGQTMSQEDFTRLYMERTGGTEEEARVVFNNPRARSRFVNQLAEAPARRPGGNADDPGTRIVGYVHREDAPALTAPELREVRERAAGNARMQEVAARMVQLAQQANAAERAGAGAGVVSDLMAEAAQLQEEVSGILRTEGNYGVPTGNELERMEALAPTLNSARGLMSAVPIFRALGNTINSRTRTRLRQYGYDPEGAQAQPNRPRRGDAPSSPSAPRQAPAGMIRVRAPDGREGNYPAGRPLPHGFQRIE